MTYLEGLVVLLLLLVDYAQPEVYLMGLVEIRLHLHDLRKSIFRVVQGAVSVIQDANAIPKPGFLLFVRVSKLVMGRRRDGPTLGFGRWTKAVWYALYACCRSSIIK